MNIPQSMLKQMFDYATYLIGYCFLTLTLAPLMLVYQRFCVASAELNGAIYALGGFDGVNYLTYVYDHLNLCNPCLIIHTYFVYIVALVYT